MILLVLQQIAAGFFAGIGGHLYEKTRKKLTGPESMPCKTCGGECRNPMGVCRRCHKEHLKQLEK